MEGAAKKAHKKYIIIAIYKAFYDKWGRNKNLYTTHRDNIPVYTYINTFLYLEWL